MNSSELIRANTSTPSQAANVQVSKASDLFSGNGNRINSYLANYVQDTMNKYPDLVNSFKSGNNVGQGFAEFFGLPIAVGDKYELDWSKNPSFEEYWRSTGHRTSSNSLWNRLTNLFTGNVDSLRDEYNSKLAQNSLAAQLQQYRNAGINPWVAVQGNTALNADRGNKEDKDNDDLMKAFMTFLTLVVGRKSRINSNNKSNSFVESYSTNRTDLYSH